MELPLNLHLRLLLVELWEDSLKRIIFIRNQEKCLWQDQIQFTRKGIYGIRIRLKRLIHLKI